MPGAWTYTFAPSSVPRDAVRMLTGQTSSVDDLLLYDQEITYCISQRPTVYGAASLGCEVLAGKYAAYPERESIGSLGLTWGDRAKNFKAQAAGLRAAQAFAALTPSPRDIPQTPIFITLRDNY